MSLILSPPRKIETGRDEGLQFEATRIEIPDKQILG
jgi:hypothetical protein